MQFMSCKEGIYYHYIQLYIYTRVEADSIFEILLKENDFKVGIENSIWKLIKVMFVCVITYLNSDRLLFHANIFTLEFLS